jgi:hypothetical protein
MKKIDKNYQRSKIGVLMDERNLTLKEFAELIYQKTGYFIAITNLSSYCTGLRKLKKLEIIKVFADTLEIPITELL